MARIETRVARITEAVLVGLGWLAQSNVERWQSGRITSLDRCIQVDKSKIAAALDALRDWSQNQCLKPWETDYRELRFTSGSDPAIEGALATRWAYAESPGPEIAPLRPRELIVISPHNDWTCASCDESGDLLVKTNSGTLCLDCADLGHLVFLPSGDAALTRRAKKASRLSAVVVRWSRRRKRYERQGILAESDAIEQAAQQCLEDPDAIHLAVAASVRHIDTDYDDLLMAGLDRDDARRRVRDRVDEVLGTWRDGAINLDP